MCPVHAPHTPVPSDGPELMSAYASLPTPQAETRAEFAERTVAKLEKTIDDLEGRRASVQTALCAARPHHSRRRGVREPGWPWPAGTVT